MQKVIFRLRVIFTLERMTQRNQTSHRPLPLASVYIQQTFWKCDNCRESAFVLRELFKTRKKKVPENYFYWSRSNIVG